MALEEPYRPHIDIGGNSITLYFDSERYGPGGNFSDAMKILKKLYADIGSRECFGKTEEQVRTICRFFDYIIRVDEDPDGKGAVHLYQCEAMDR